MLNDVQIMLPVFEQQGQSENGEYTYFENTDGDPCWGGTPTAAKGLEVTSCMGAGCDPPWIQ